jgi:hypothetical protein
VQRQDGGLAGLSSACQSPLAVPALRIVRGEVWTARFDSVVPALEVRFV